MIAMLTGISLIGLIVGCDEDARLARLAQDAAERQARQNEEMARVVHSSNEAARGLVTADAEAREALLAAQRDLQQQQAVVGQQRDRLETERREMADARRWDSQVGSAIGGAAMLLACLLPLLLGLYLLMASRDDSPDSAELAELLTKELVAEKPVLLPMPQGPVLTYRPPRERDASEETPSESPGPSQA